MIELLWIIFLCSPTILLSKFFHDISIKTKIIFCVVFYILLYANIGYSLQLLKITINTFSIFITILIVDLLIVYFLFKNNEMKNIFNWNIETIKISRLDIIMAMILILSFFLYYFNQSRSFSLLVLDSWYWFSGINFIMDNGFLFAENSLWAYDILYWYPDGFHYLWAITFLPYSSIDSHSAVKLIGPMFGVLTLIGLWEYFKEHESYLVISSIIYTVSMFYLIHRFSMFIPEGMSIFMVVFLCIVLRDYELDSKVITILAIFLGLLTNIYHSIGLILFLLTGILLFILKIRAKKRYLFFYFISSLFFLLPYILNYEGFLIYKSHLEYVAKDPHLWINYIKASGIVFFAKPGVRETVIGVPLAVLYPVVLINSKLKDRSIVFSSILMIFSVFLGVSYLFWESGFSPRSLVLFSISSALLFPFFIDYCKKILDKRFKKKSDKIMFILLILILINRLLIISFAFPEIDCNLTKTDKIKMVLWVDDNIPIESNIIIQKDFFNVDIDEGNTIFIKRALYPREVIFTEDYYNLNEGAYYISYNSSFTDLEVIHKEKNILLIMGRDE